MLSSFQAHVAQCALLCGFLAACSSSTMSTGTGGPGPATNGQDPETAAGQGGLDTPPMNLPPATTTPTTEPPDDGKCGEVTVTLTRQVPDVMLVLDGSGSMQLALGSDDENPAAGGSRWDATKTALTADPGGLVTQLDASVRFGVTVYRAAGDVLSPGTCPALDATPIAANNLAAVTNVMSTVTPQGGTPTAQALSQVVAMWPVTPGTPDQKLGPQVIKIGRAHV